jgi:RimJ/RimL family protein N-acetyltransferase
MIIETARLSLRALTPDDAEAILAGDRAGRSWAPDFPTPGDVNIADAALLGKMSFARDAMPWGLFTVIERSSGQSIGGIGFKSPPNELGEVEIGYGICQSFQGRGVATDAVLALCDFARRGARVVLADTDRDNVASQRVLEKGGFQRGGENDELIHWRKELTAPD